jgi:hypothetical protein
MKGVQQITTTDFTRLLYELRDHKPKVSVRFKKLGHKWSANFMQVVDLRGSGAAFYDLALGEFAYVPHLSDIIQFEIDVRLMDYEPHFHYEIVSKKS